jgi:hypothetical protein
MISSLKVAAEKMLLDFERTNAVPHNLTKGEAREAVVLQNFLKPYLPSRYSVGKAIIIDIEDKASKQQDLVIFDSFNTPILENLEESLLLFPESVLAAIEVKSVLTKAELEDIIDKSISVWQLKKTAHPSLTLAPNLILPSNHLPTLCIGFCYEPNLTVADIRDELRILRGKKSLSNALSFICILRDKQGKAGTIVNVDSRELSHILTIATTDSRLALVECDSAGTALLHTYLILMEHLRSCGLIIPIPNLIEYAKAGGLRSSNLQVHKDDAKGSYVSVEGK